jgi:CRP-like cAMP-binding protein
MSISEHVLLALLKEPDARATTDLEQIASFCRLFSVFNDIPEHLFIPFCRIIEIEEFDAGATIYSEGSVGSSWYTIVEGSVFACTTLNSTTPVRTVLKIGDSFGRYAVQQDVILTETIACAEHVYVLRVDRRPYQELMQNVLGGLEGEGHGFAVEFLRALIALPGMQIATSVTRRVFPSNAVVVKQGEEADGVYYIAAGSCAVIREIATPGRAGQPPARLVEIDELTPGSLFGLRSLVLKTAEAVSVVAKCELVTLFLNRMDFYRKVDLKKQRGSLPPEYPDDATIRKMFKKQMLWEQYKKKVVKDVLTHKKAKRTLGLQY